MKKPLKSSNKDFSHKRKKCPGHRLNSRSIERPQAVYRHHTNSNFCQDLQTSRPTTVCSRACLIKVSAVLGEAKSTKRPGSG
jgi:hypothetical protein